MDRDRLGSVRSLQFGLSGCSDGSRSEVCRAAEYHLAAVGEGGGEAGPCAAAPDDFEQYSLLFYFIFQVACHMCHVVILSGILSMNALYGITDINVVNQV